MTDLAAVMTGVPEAVDVVANLAARLRATRVRRGVSYRTAADQMGLSPSIVWRVEEGGANIRYSTVLAVLYWMNDPDP